MLDNASYDGSAQAVAARFPQVRFVQNAENGYFSAAYTQGIQLAQADYVLALNPDMQVRGATLQRLLSALQADPSIGAATTTMYFPDGRLQRNGSRFPTFGYLVLNYTFIGKLYRWLAPKAGKSCKIGCGTPSGIASAHARSTSCPAARSSPTARSGGRRATSRRA